MNETPSNPSPRNLSMSCLSHLEYAMAGDMESIQLVQKLMGRWREIPWDDPAFIASSHEMQTQGNLPLACDGESAVELRSLAYTLMQKNAEMSETISTALPNFRMAVERAQQQQAWIQSLLEYIKAATELHSKMRDHLEMLDADATSYALPPIPNVPEL